MKIVIHPGMHKTGSSAIQDHFFKTAYPGLRYARWNTGNHSGLFVLLFQEPELLTEYHGFKPRGPEFYARLPQMREDWRASLTEDLTQAQAAGETLVFSAEAISAPNLNAAMGRMAAFFREWSADITVLAYVRRPLSYATSAFQQMLKGADLRTLNTQKLWPNYQARFVGLDEVFGRERVILKPYDRDSLTGGDVVRDFAATIGVEMAAAPALEANTSLSAEATALLFAQRRLGQGFVAGFGKANAANTAFIDALRGIGSGKLSFSDSLWNPVLEKNRADLDWIEDRLGVPLRETPTPDAIAISGEEDLFRLAEENQPALETALLGALHRDQRPALDKTVSTLELLRRLSYDPYSSL
jgi:hypothetical protein